MIDSVIFFVNLIRLLNLCRLCPFDLMFYFHKKTIYRLSGLIGSKAVDSVEKVNYFWMPE